MSDHGFHSFRREREPQHLAGAERLHGVRGPGEREEDAGRPLRPRQVLGGRRLEPRPAPTRWASARSTSTCAGARRRASSPRAPSTRRCRTRSRPSSSQLADPDDRRAGDARRLPARRHLQGRVPAVRARPAGRASTTATAWAGRTPWAAISRAVVENNNRKWSGDHCATATEISGGVFFTQPQDRAPPTPHIMDLAPTILKTARRARCPRTSTASRCCDAAAGASRSRCCAPRPPVAAAAGARRPARRPRPATTRLQQVQERRKAPRARARAAARRRRRACSARWSGSSWRCGCAARSCARPRSVLQRTNEQLEATRRARRASSRQPRRGAARRSRRARAPSTSWASCPTCACCSRWTGRPTSSAATGFVTHAGAPRQRAHRALPRRPAALGGDAGRARAARRSEALALRDRARRARAARLDADRAPQDASC